VKLKADYLQFHSHECFSEAKNSQMSSSQYSSEERANNSTTVSMPEAPTKYEVRRRIITISDLYREWVVELSEYPSVQELDSKKKSKWRDNEKEKRF
jgi:hypothetical protein